MVVWAIFTLQDSVLVGLRSASWVVVENGVFGIVKLVLLVVLVTSLPDHLGIYVSWMLPVLVAVPLINMLIFGTLVPSHTLLTQRLPAPEQPADRPLPGRRLLGGAVPAGHRQPHPGRGRRRIDSRQTAYFYMAWVIASAWST